jgi:hypothetical protein
MNEISISARSTNVLPSDLVRELGLQMSNHIMGGHGRLTQAPTVREQLARCDVIGRRAEVEQFVENFDNEVTDEMRREFAISVHPVQVGSKLWLIDELGRHCDLSASSLVMLGAWYGILPLIINWRLADPPRQMVCIDSDPTVCEAGVRMIGSLYSDIEYRCADVMALNYGALDTCHPPVVINTICEHLPDLPRWWARIPPGQLVVVQNNNYTECPDHINCVRGTEQFRQQCPFSELLFEGALHFPELDRFMLIGRR